MVDVLVIGGGLAGAVAALELHALGAQVGLASRSYGATALSSGALQIAHTTTLADNHYAAPLQAHLHALIEAQPRHPFSILGKDKAREHIEGGYERLAQILAGTGLDLAPLGWSQKNALTPSALGCLLPVAMPLGPHRGWNVADAQCRFGIVQIAHDPHFQASALCRGIAYDAAVAGLPAATLEPIVVNVPSLRNYAHSPFALAKALDDRQTCLELIELLRPLTEHLQGLIFAPILGYDRFAEVRQWIAEALGMPIIETLSPMPSVPGMRLQRVLDAALDKAQIKRFGEVTALTGDKKCLMRAELKGDVALQAQAFVLATGRFVAEGICWQGAKIEESLLKLPCVGPSGLLAAQSPQAVTSAAIADTHAVLSAGLEIDDVLRPLSQTEVVYDNLFACGMVVGGFTAHDTLCADGVALATAYGAAQQAWAILQKRRQGATP